MTSDVLLAEMQRATYTAWVVTGIVGVACGILLQLLFRAARLTRMPWLFLVLVLIACSKPSEPASPSPPKLPDLYSELRTHTPGDLAKANPKPLPWMIGCFTFTAPAELRWLDSISPGLQLTDRLVDDVQFKSTYAVESLGRRTGPPWSWMPVSEERIEVNVSTGFVGWTFDLHQAETGLEGTGRWWSDTADTGSPVAVAFRRTPCT